MAALVCDLCGGKLIMGAGGIATCESCGMEHSADRMKEKVQEIKGTVRVDNSHMIENYLEMAQTAKNAGNNAEAESYCNKIIEIEPTNYKAWMLKGKASGWQSTLQSSRVQEAVSAFSKGISNAPDEEKDELAEDVKEEITNLSRAMISLRGERFAKWPDDEETSGFISDISNILQAITQFMQMSGVAIKPSVIMGPLATLINQSVVQAYKKVIYPEYKSDRYPYPNQDDWRKFIHRIDLCTKLVNLAISLCDDDDKENIQRYENLVFLEQQAIDSCSYDSKYLDYDPYNMGISSVRARETILRNDGYFPDSANSRYYFRNFWLSDEAKSIRRKDITNYNTKINDIKKAKKKREEEEARKRFNDYWAEHAEEKATLEAEQKDLNSKIAAFNKEIAAIPGQEEIDNVDKRLKKLTEEKTALGLFKGKEKKAFQEQIDQANTEKKGIQDRMNAAKKEIEAKISPLQNRVNTISNELTKAR